MEACVPDNSFHLDSLFLVCRVSIADEDDSIIVLEEQTSLFSHQVAGHTAEPMRCLGNKILKPLIKEEMFLNEKQLRSNTEYF